MKNLSSIGIAPSDCRIYGSIHISTFGQNISANGGSSETAPKLPAINEAEPVDNQTFEEYSPIKS
jgi:hypothetical protein